MLPVNGIANRMRAIDSGIHLSEKFKSKIQIFWLRDEGLNCNFNTIFLSLPFIHDSDNWLIRLLFYLDRRFKSARIISLFFERIGFLKIFHENDYQELSEFANKNKRNYLFVLIKSYSTFYPGNIFNTQLFKLKPEIEALIRKETEFFTKNTVGVHVRRKDNNASIENSPLELFEEYMLKELQYQPLSNFYIASDDPIIKEYFKMNIFWKDRVIVTSCILNRDSKEGIIQSVVELFSLSCSRKIIGSYWSSFSEIASVLGNVNLEIIKKCK